MTWSSFRSQVPILLSGSKGGRWARVGGTCRLPRALAALGGRSTGKSQRVLQAEMWVPWVLSCSVRGPMAGPVTPPLPHVPGCLPQRLSVALLGHLLTHSSLLVPPCLGPGCLLSSCPLLGPESSGWSGSVYTNIAAQVDKGTLQERRTSQEENLKQTKPGVWAFPKVSSPFFLAQTLPGAGYWFDLPFVLRLDCPVSH